VSPQAQKFLEKLKTEKIGVVTVVGKNRTGKSYLLNKVVLNKNTGFQVGHTVNPCTKV
jgi:Guanylate-binding protein, N-terminal domain.